MPRALDLAISPPGAGALVSGAELKKGSVAPPLLSACPKRNQAHAPRIAGRRSGAAADVEHVIGNPDTVGSKQYGVVALQFEVVIDHSYIEKVSNDAGRRCFTSQAGYTKLSRITAVESARVRTGSIAWFACENGIRSTGALMPWAAANLSI